jgi:hypothetical protein
MPADLLGRPSRRARGEAGSGVGEEHSAHDQPDPQGSDQPRAPGGTPPLPQRPPQADGAGHIEPAGHDEVGDLDPAQLPQAQQADRVAAEVEPVAGERLDQGHHQEQRAGHDPAGQQPPRLAGLLRCGVGCPSVGGHDPASHR